MAETHTNGTTKSVPEAAGARETRLPAESLEELGRQAKQALVAARRQREEEAKLRNRLHFGNDSLGDNAFGHALRFKKQQPGEGKHSYVCHHASLMSSFMPKCSVEITLIETFIRIDWEIVKRRAAREEDLSELARERIRHHVIERFREKNSRPSDYGPGHASGSTTRRSYWSRFADIDHEAVEGEVERILDVILDMDSSDPTGRDPDCTEVGLNPLRLMSDVMYEASDRIRSHDEAIMALEDQRSRALNQFIRFRTTIRPQR